MSAKANLEKLQANLDAARAAKDANYNRETMRAYKDAWNALAAATAARRPVRQAGRRSHPAFVPEDSPCIEDGVHNCNDWGTGEGRYHGRI